jgi:phosphoribosylaminoimidazole-succinocarboxamide synthase
MDASNSFLGIGLRVQGKVRDVYTIGDKVILVATDRMSAFDRHLANIPCKGAVLNQTTAWWMQATRHIVPNALLSTPHENVTVMKRCAGFKVEFVVRAYLTGTTSTSIWSHYKAGARTYCGHTLPEGA